MDTTGNLSIYVSHSSFSSEIARPSNSVLSVPLLVANGYSVSVLPYSFHHGKTYRVLVFVVIDNQEIIKSKV